MNSGKVGQAILQPLVDTISFDLPTTPTLNPSRFPSDVDSLVNHLEGITHQPPTPPSRSTWILETVTPQIQKINTIFAMFRVFSTI
jgi:hypothetical protein